MVNQVGIAMLADTKIKKKDLGIYYTPELVVDLIFSILKIWKNEEDETDGKWAKRKHYPSVIDPACGEGIFLKKAIETGLTRAKFVWGVDIDGSVIQKWKDINLMQLFNSKADPNLHFFNQNGLLPLDGKLRFRHKRGGLKEFDVVVGNPPYGGVGIDNIDDELEKALQTFEIWKKDSGNNSPDNQTTLALSGDKKRIKESIKQRLKKFPIEILFIERFIQLAKDGGWIAIIIPEGILANSNLTYAREFISKNTRIEAIISLPRDAFKNAGTSAKTSILFLRKAAQSENDYPIFLASMESITPENMSQIIRFYEKFYETKQSIA